MPSRNHKVQWKNYKFINSGLNVKFTKCLVETTKYNGKIASVFVVITNSQTPREDGKLQTVSQKLRIKMENYMSIRSNY